MSTLRKDLNEKGFDWESGMIVYQAVSEEAYSPGWAGENELSQSVQIDENHPILDEEFFSGYGSPQMPRFVACDSTYIYFPVQRDGATFIAKVLRLIGNYIGSEMPTPYPGG